ETDRGYHYREEDDDRKSLLARLDHNGMSCTLDDLQTDALVRGDLRSSLLELHVVDERTSTVRNRGHSLCGRVCAAGEREDRQRSARHGRQDRIRNHRPATRCSLASHQLSHLIAVRELGVQVGEAGQSTWVTR